MKKHFDFIDINSDGYLVCAASCLTGRRWNADVWLFASAANAAHVRRRMAHRAVDDCGVSCVRFVDGLAVRMIMCQDNGAIEVVGWEPEDNHNNDNNNINNNKNKNDYNSSSDNKDHSSDELKKSAAVGSDAGGDHRPYSGRDLDHSGDLEDQLVCHGRAVEHEGGVLCVDTWALADGDKSEPSRAITGAADGCVKVWDLEALVSERTYRHAHTHWVTGVAARPGQTGCCQMATCSLDGRVLLWDTRVSTTASPASYLVRDGDGDRARCISWSPLDVTSVAVGWESGRVSLHNILMPHPPSSSSSPSAIFCRPVQALRWHERRPWLAACADKCDVAVLHADSENNSAGQLGLKHRDSLHSDMVRSVCWIPGEDQLVSCGWDSQIICRTVPV